MRSSTRVVPAGLRRRIPVAVAAERASVGRSTLNRVENGDPNVSLGIYATVLFVLGLVDRIADLADARNDATGLQLDEEHLPKRIRTPKPPSHKEDCWTARFLSTST